MDGVFFAEGGVFRAEGGVFRAEGGVFCAVGGSVCGWMGRVKPLDHSSAQSGDQARLWGVWGSLNHLVTERKGKVAR